MPRVFEICDFIIRQEAFEKLIERIRMPAEYAREAMDALWQELDEFACTEKREYPQGTRAMVRQLLAALANRASGAWCGIEEDVWIDTLKCFSRYANEHKRMYGFYGFDRADWTERHVNARIFRLGELEYELKQNADGAPVLGIHIPSDAVLEKSALNASVKRAREFFAAHFPKYADAPMTCESWLLSYEVASVLGAKSRVLTFRHAFEPIQSGGDCIDALIKFVFKLPPDTPCKTDYAALPERTRLEKGLKRLLLEGKTVCTGSGVLKREF